jgi:HPt (histidine-containing phosphotransfer) domain-containing protein
MSNNAIALTDLNYLKTTCGGSEEMVNQIVNMFLESTPELISEMKTSLAEENWEVLKRNAHKAKSSFLMIGAKITGKKLERIELGTENPTQTDLGDLVAEVENESDYIFKELKNALI